jgi:hypothetical protein
MGDKLYWRTKKNGKWTWKPAVIAKEDGVLTWGETVTVLLQEEEE